MAKIGRIEALIGRDLDQYSEELNEVVFACMSQAMKKCKKDLLANCKPEWKDYKKGWTIRTKRLKYGYEGYIYNRTKPGLTHLLEKSHVVSNQFGQYGRSTPYVHIAPAAEAAEGYFVDLIVQKVSEI